MFMDMDTFGDFSQIWAKLTLAIQNGTQFNEIFWIKNLLQFNWISEFWITTLNVLPESWFVEEFRIPELLLWSIVCKN